MLPNNESTGVPFSVISRAFEDQGIVYVHRTRGADGGNVERLMTKREYEADLKFADSKYKKVVKSIQTFRFWDGKSIIEDDESSSSSPSSNNGFSHICSIETYSEPVPLRVLSVSSTLSGREVVVPPLFQKYIERELSNETFSEEKLSNGTFV